MSLIDTIISKIAPHDCVGCGQEGALLCPQCSAKLVPAESRLLSCGLQVSAVTAYKSVAKELIWHLKFQGAQSAATIMAQRMNEIMQPDGKTLVVPVPTATKRVRQRGYDQAKLLARHLAKQQRIPYLNCLKRYGQTHQVGASREQRLSQLQNAFSLEKDFGTKMHNKRIILVDDVMTTGATLEAASSVLRAAGVRNMQAVVFACA